MISQAGVDLIKRHEKCCLEWYLPTPEDKPTCGWGHMDPAGVIGTPITQAQADAFLDADLTKFDSCVTEECPEASDEQHAAMCCLAYNIGCGAFTKSSVARLHNAGRYSEAAQAFGLWNKQDGKVLIELVHRRAEEAALYASGTTVAPEVAVPVAGHAEGPKPIILSKTMISTATAAAGTAVSAVSQVHDQARAVQEVVDQVSDTTTTAFNLWTILGHHLGIVALILVIAGVSGIVYDYWIRHSTGRS